MLLTIGLIALAAALYYKLRRCEELFSETLDYYENITKSQSKSLQNHHEMVALLAHDLKSPLAGLISSAQALEMAGTTLPKPFLECLRLMQATGRTNLRLLSNFLELLRSNHCEAVAEIIPKNRLDLIRSLVEPSLLREDRVEWIAAPWLLKTTTPLRVLALALAELISYAYVQGNGEKVRVEELFCENLNKLQVSIRGLAKEGFATSEEESVNLRLAKQVLEKLNLECSTIEHSEVQSYFEFSIPVCEYVAAGDTKIADEQEEMFAHAELLLEYSIQQVQSAQKSLGNLTQSVEQDESLEDSAGEASRNAADQQKYT